MDILEVLSKIGFDFRLFLFNLINFIVIGLILYKFVFKKISSILENREDLIKQGIDNSLKSEQVLVTAKIDAENIVLNAKDKAREIMEEVTRKSTLLAEELKAQAKDDAHRIIEKARLDADAIKTEYMGNIKNEITSLVIEASEAVLEKELNTTHQEVDQIVQDTVKSRKLKTALNK